MLTWLDRARRDELTAVPGDNPAGLPLGVFSTRSPDRPSQSTCTGSRSSPWAGLRACSLAHQFPLATFDVKDQRTSPNTAA
jgi:hypothetical protein